MKQLLCYGDSNTWGLVPGTDRRYAWEKRWTGILQNRLASRGIHILEEGLCGRTTVFQDVSRPGRKGLETLPLILETHRPIDAAIVMLGTNDCKTAYHASASEIADGLKQCLELLLEVLPGERILAISPIRLGEDEWKPEYDPEFNRNSVGVSEKLFEEYRKVTEPLGISLLNAAEAAQPSSEDQEHLSEEGHKLLAEAIYRELKEKKMLGEI